MTKFGLFDFISRWRDEAKSLTARFQVKSKELRGKINSLRKENAELHKTLFLCKQQFTQFRTDTIQHRYKILEKLSHIKMTYLLFTYIFFSFMVLVIYKDPRPGDNVLY